MRKLFLLTLLGGAVLILTLPIIAFFILDSPVPVGRSGPDADALAERVQTAVNIEAWNKTGAIKWTFSRGHHLLWDKQRGFGQIRWGEDEKKPDHEVLLDLNTGKAVARRNGQMVSGSEGQKLAATGLEFWRHEAFWLNPIATFFDPDVERSLARDQDGKQALLIKYKRGGWAPNDTFLWSIDTQSGVPYGFKMWVALTPVGGMWATWDEWVRVKTGALIARIHRTFIFDIVVTNLEAAPTLAELVGADDPFALLAPQIEPSGLPGDSETR